MKRIVELGDSSRLVIDTSNSTPFIVGHHNSSLALGDEETIALLLFFEEYGQSVMEDIDQAMRDRKHGEVEERYRDTTIKSASQDEDFQKFIKLLELKYFQQHNQ